MFWRPYIKLSPQDRKRQMLLSQRRHLSSLEDQTLDQWERIVSEDELCLRLKNMSNWPLIADRIRKMVRDADINCSVRVLIERTCFRSAELGWPRDNISSKGALERRSRKDELSLRPKAHLRFVQLLIVLLHSELPRIQPAMRRPTFKGDSRNERNCGPAHIKAVNVPFFQN